MDAKRWRADFHSDDNEFLERWAFFELLSILAGCPM
jgi:hypothetical protein